MDEDQEEKVVSNGPKEEEVNEEKKVKEEEPDGEKANGTPTPNKEEVDEIVEVPSEKGDTKALTNGKSKLSDEDYFRLSSAEIMTHYPPISTEMSAKYTYKCIKENCVPKLEDVAKSKDPVIKEIFSKAEVWRPKPPVVIKDFKPRKPRAPRGKSKKAPKPLDLSDPNQYYQNLMQPPPTEELVQMKSSEVLRINQELNLLQRQVAILREMVKNGSHRLADRIDSNEDFLSLLGNEKEPSLKDEFGEFHLTSGFRFIDLAILRKAIEQAQMCGCKMRGGTPNISLLELPAHRSQIGLATHLILRCSVCTKSTVFPNSAFSRQYPANYSINKLMLPLLGPASYYKLTNFLQSTERIGRPIPKGREAANLVLSIDNRRFDFPDLGPMTEEETESLMNSPIHALQAAGPPQLAQPPQVQLPRMPSYAQRSAAPMNHQLPPIQRGIASGTANRLPLPPNLLSAALRHPTPQQFRINYQQSAFGQNRLQQVPASLVLNQMAASMQQQRPAAIRPQLVRAQPQPPPPPPPSLMPPLSRTHAGRLEKPINTYIRSPMTVPAFPKPTGGTQKQPMKIKASPELPAGSKISIVPPGSRIVGKVCHSTPFRTGLNPGVYRVRRQGDPEKYLIIRNEPVAADEPNNPSSLPVISGVASTKSILRKPTTNPDPLGGGGGLGEDPGVDPLACEDPPEQDDDDDDIQEITPDEIEKEKKKKEIASQAVSKEDTNGKVGSDENDGEEETEEDIDLSEFLKVRVTGDKKNAKDGEEDVDGEEAEEDEKSEDEDDYDPVEQYAPEGYESEGDQADNTDDPEAYSGWQPTRVRLEMAERGKEPETGAEAGGASQGRGKKRGRGSDFDPDLDSGSDDWDGSDSKKRKRRKKKPAK